MAKLVTVAEMGAIEKAADTSGLSYAQMMQNAGRSLANSVIAHSQSKSKSILGLVGPGNNGGDTLVALSALSGSGWEPTAYVVGKREVNDAYLARLRDADGKVVEQKDDAAFSQLATLISNHRTLLDGLLGTGVQLPLREPFAQVLRAANAAISSAKTRPYIVAVDCPSGMETDKGAIPPEILKADLTVSMAAVKRGMLTLPAFGYLGDLEIGEIGLDPNLGEWVSIKRFSIDEEMVRPTLPLRPLDAHKGTFGTALIVAGSLRFPGAALLASKAAYRCGAGLVTVAVPSVLLPALAGHLPEATWLPLPVESGTIASRAAAVIKKNIGSATAILLGPGFGQSASTAQFIKAILKADLPLAVIDADGLKLLATIKDWYKLLPKDSVLTPHPGEMSILTGLKTETIQAGRIETAEKFAKKWKQVVVLKGAFTVVAAPDGRTAVMPLATPALARAGTGDLLAGLITGLRAQGMAAYEAACAGVWLHGQAGVRAAARLGGTAGVLAGDLIGELPALIGI